jgi:hypothetical protein
MLRRRRAFSTSPSFRWPSSSSRTAVAFLCSSSARPCSLSATASRGGLVAGSQSRPARPGLAWRSPCWPGTTATAYERSRDRGRVPLAVVCPRPWQQVGDPGLRMRRTAGTGTSHALGPSVGSDGLAEWRGLEQFVVGHGTHVPDANPRAVEGVQAFAFVSSSRSPSAWRRFGAPYGLFAAASLAISAIPAHAGPAVIPRFGLAIFPLFLALAAMTATKPRRIRGRCVQRLFRESRSCSGPSGSGSHGSRTRRGHTGRVHISLPLATPFRN